MPSEKQIDTVARMLDPDAFTLEKTMLLMKGEMFGHHGERVRAARGKAEELLTAAEQVEPAPAARSGSVKVDKLAEEIRRVDGNNSLGAGALAEALMPFLSALEPAEPAPAAEPYLWLHPWNGSTSKYHNNIAADCPKDGPQPIPLFTLPPEPEGNAQPWGYWVKHKYAEGGFLRTPCFTPEADYYTDVIPLYTHPSPSEARLRDALGRLLNHYVELVKSGDAGFWDPEKEDEVIAARAALKEDSE